MNKYIIMMKNTKKNHLNKKTGKKNPNLLRDFYYSQSE